MPAPEAITQLVQRFRENQQSYSAASYNEAQLRQEFINPLFEALGWDMVNKQGIAEAYKEVIHEDAIKIGSAMKAPDYCFRVGRERKFFVEAKKPSVNVKEDIGPAFQLRRYAWSAKLPLSIVTDFEEFAVYECRTKPSKADKASTGRILYFTFADYETRWDEISGIFSKDAVLKGSFDRYAESSKGKKGTAAVDAAFLKEIENWRELLAKNIALRNPQLSQRELNFAIQRTIDRIIFLRICEDRGIENYGALMSHLNGVNVYRRLCKLFRDADDKYNSGIFHFQKEKDRPEEPDELTLNLDIDDKTLKEIIKNLYYPESPYEFSVLSADILGQVYEQFLGKVIRLTPGHQAKVEDKPEVKKAGGVYYTPTYIVDYIVKNTVGKLLEGKTPKEVSKIRVLDPACGSGSFLIGAYQYLLDWHRDWYVQNDPHKWCAGKNPALYLAHCPSPCGEGGPRTAVGEVRSYRLTTPERKRILLNNIYGVDIDTQAVEVTKLSLLLKVLEGENEQSIAQQLKLFHERALPDLGSNIKCGNSLIGSDFYVGKPVGLFEDDEKYRINAFDWDGNGGFPEIMKAGGFDAVIGNPPYVFGRDWKALGISNDTKEYLRRKYVSSSYQLDMFSIFMEKAFCLCRTSGRIGQIVPNVWLNNSYSAGTRALAISNSAELTIAVPRSKVFPRLTVDTIVYTLAKVQKASATFDVVEIERQGSRILAAHKTGDYVAGTRPISIAINRANDFLVRLSELPASLGDVANITRGVHPYRTGGYGQSAFGNGPQTDRDCKERPYNSDRPQKSHRPFIYGRDLKRFKLPLPKDYVHYGPWLAEPRQTLFFEGKRVYSRKILGERLVITMVDDDSVADQQVYITKPADQSIAAECITGILGSRLVGFYARTYYNEGNDSFPQIKVSQLRSLPIPSINKVQHDRMVNLVNSMLDLNKSLPVAKTEHEKTLLQRQIDSTDKQIDALVYELYGLTEEEIKIVEGENN